MRNSVLIFFNNWNTYARSLNMSVKPFKLQVHKCCHVLNIFKDDNAIVLDAIENMLKLLKKYAIEIYHFLFYHVTNWDENSGLYKRGLVSNLERGLY